MHRNRVRVKTYICKIDNVIPRARWIMAHTPTRVICSYRRRMFRAALKSLSYVWFAHEIEISLVDRFVLTLHTSIGMLVVGNDGHPSQRQTGLTGILVATCILEVVRGVTIDTLACCSYATEFMNTRQCRWLCTEHPLNGFLLRKIFSAEESRPTFCHNFSSRKSLTHCCALISIE